MSPKLEDKDLLNRGTSAVASRGNKGSCGARIMQLRCSKTAGSLHALLWVL